VPQRHFETKAGRWSSYSCNAEGAADQLIEPHLQYSQLGVDPLARQAAYRELFEGVLDDTTRDAIRRAWRTGTPLGDDRFHDRIAKATGRRVGYARRGRPRNSNSNKGL